MSLTDVCFDTLAELGAEVRNYSGWGYDTQHLAEVIDAMFSLAQVVTDLNDPFQDEGFDSRLAQQRSLLLALLPDPVDTDTEDLDTMITALAALAVNDTRLYQALLNVHGWAISAEARDFAAERFPEFSVIKPILSCVRRH